MGYMSTISHFLGWLFLLYLHILSFVLDNKLFVTHVITLQNGMNFLKRLFSHLSRLCGLSCLSRAKPPVQVVKAHWGLRLLVRHLVLSRLSPLWCFGWISLCLWCYSWLLGLVTSLVLLQSRLSGSVWASMVCWDSGHKYFGMYSTILMKNSHIRYYPLFAIEKPRFMLYLQQGEKCIRYWVIKQEVIIGWDLRWQAMY